MKLFRTWVGPCAVAPLLATVKASGLRAFGGSEHLYIEADSAWQIVARTGLPLLGDAVYHSDVGQNIAQIFLRS